MTLYSFQTVNITVKFERKDRERGRRIREGYEKIRNFQPISRRISETVQDRTKGTINH